MGAVCCCKGERFRNLSGLAARCRWQRFTQAMLCRVREQLQTWKELIEKLEKGVTQGIIRSLSLWDYSQGEIVPGAAFVAHLIIITANGEG